MEQVLGATGDRNVLQNNPAAALGHSTSPPGLPPNELGDGPDDGIGGEFRPKEEHTTPIDGKEFSFISS